jgi:hypothetical protein
MCVRRARYRNIKLGLATETIDPTQGHLVKGEDTEAFSSLLWSRNCTSKTVGARPNLRPHLK